MDEFNSIVEIINNALPMVQSGIPAITGGFITACFCVEIPGVRNLKK